MIAFKEIVVPTDFSEHSLRAIDYATGLAEKFGSRLELVYVVEAGLQPADLAWTNVDYGDLNRQHREAAQKHMEGIAKERIPEGISASVSILIGKAFVEIVRFAESVNADLIVMATHGYGGFSHLLLGSTAERVVRKAPCPVLTIKHPLPVSPIS
ncbi:MAG: universal stress protein [Candidatus Latescibacteria bacterium]|nr:universal stress protein [Candidatus Latescibacterota bacterium]NIO27269.1 universal stress protein [Candidatus Latescibacterota bacterium]NIO54793.1 universal stress protein [Candidatus Latescibacterota bacterium]NIT00876.1 universal stress protein [Candidatus Latescibacterota bacterium]NIT37799.1 universal stress protein [Candidatus Latescibacterota bacterium]